MEIEQAKAVRSELSGLAPRTKYLINLVRLTDKKDWLTTQILGLQAQLVDVEAKIEDTQTKLAAY